MCSLSPGSSVDGPGHGSSLSGEVIAEIKGVEVKEGCLGNSTD